MSEIMIWVINQDYYDEEKGCLMRPDPYVQVPISNPLLLEKLREGES